MKTETNRLTRWMRANRSRRPHKDHKIRLFLTRLEDRDNPSVPAALLDVPQLTFDFGQTGYSEAHTLSKSFTNTITADESGGGASGSYTIDVVTQTHLRDDATGRGGDISSATGTLTTDVSCHLVIHGTHTLLGDVVNDETYTENGTATETHSVARNFAGGGSEQADGDHSSTWTTSWTGTVTNSGLSFTSFSYVRSDVTHWHLHDNYAFGGYSDQRISTGSDVNETGSGNQATYAGHTWWEEHDHTHFPGPSAGPSGPPMGPPVGPPMDFYYDYSWNTPFAGSVQLPTDPRTQSITWNAETPDAVNFSWHGVTATNGTLTETATYTDGRLDVNSFSSTSHDSDLSHLVEDEPSVLDSGTGQENYHKDEIYAYSDDTSGHGSYVNNAYSADFHVGEVASDSAHDILAVDNDHSYGVNDDGESFDLMFNYRSDRITSGTFENDFDYHDGDDGTSMVNSMYSSSGGSQTNYQQWGIYDGTNFNESSNTSESVALAFGRRGDNVPINSSLLSGAYPFNTIGSGEFLAGYATFTAPPLPPGIWFVNDLPGHILNDVLTEWYNHKIMEIGENAKLKVGKLAVQSWVMPEIVSDGEHCRPAGQFVAKGELNGKKVDVGQNFAQAIGRGSDLDERIKYYTKSMKEQLGYSDVKLEAAEVQIMFGVIDADKITRAGKCAVHYQINLKFSAKKNGVIVNPVRNDFQGDLWFEDDNLKTMNFPRP